MEIHSFSWMPSEPATVWGQWLSVERNMAISSPHTGMPLCSGQGFLKAVAQPEAFLPNLPSFFLSFHRCQTYITVRSLSLLLLLLLHFLSHRYCPNRSSALHTLCLLSRIPKQIQLTWSFELYGEKDSIASVLLVQILAEVVRLWNSIHGKMSYYLAASTVYQWHLLQWLSSALWLWKLFW